MPVIVGVALGGALGASARYGIDRFITTFSTFEQETLTLVEARDLAVALAYVLGSVGAGIVAVYAGVLLGRTL